MRNKTNHTPLTRGSRLTDAKLLLIITICVFVVMYLCAVLFLGSGFKKPQTFFNILNENAALLILSCGMSLVMITGGIDISVGTLTALVCMSCAVNLDFHGGTVLTAILLALGIGTAFGLVQGFLIAYLEIQPFIVTLAGMFFAKGMTTIVNATQFNVENEAFKALKETRIYVPGMGSVNKLGAYVPAYVEIGVVVALVVVAVLFVVLRWTRFGRSVYAVGGNEQSARLMGLPVDKTKMMVYGFNGFCSALAGIAYALYVKSGWNLALQGGELDVISAAVIGGVLLSGGVGYMVGTFFGVLLKAVIPSLITFNGTLSSWWGKIITGALVLLFVALQQIVMHGKLFKKKSGPSHKKE